MQKKSKRHFLPFLFLLPVLLLAFSLSFLLFSCNDVHLLCPQNEATCIFLHQHHHPPPHPKTSIFLSFSVKEAIPVPVPVPVPVPRIPSPTNQTAYQSSRRLSRKHRTSLTILRPAARSKQFAQRTTQFLRPLNSNNAACNLTFFMIWIAPLEFFGSRELFAIESLFKRHPDACLLIISTTLDSSKGFELLRPFSDNAFRVVALSPNYEYLVSGTPAEIWFNQIRKGELDPGEVSMGQNLSNLLRLLLLYKYGGIYIDADVIIVKSFLGLRNCIGAQTVDAVTHEWSRLNNAVMVFDKKHPLLLEFIGEFASTFDGNKWGHNGPYLVSRVVRRVAGKSNCNINVLPPIAFYPLDWSRVRGLFRGPPTDEAHPQWMREKLYWIQKSSFAVHLWNRESRHMRVEKGSIIARILLDCCMFCNSSVPALLQ